MNIESKIVHRLIKENATECKMFWCIPKQVDGGLKWEIMDFNSDGDDLSNWSIVLHKLGQDWEKDFSICKDKHTALPRGILADGILFHGNNLPKDCPLRKIAKKLGVKLGETASPQFHKLYGIKKDHLDAIEEVIGQGLGLQFTETD